MPKYQAPPGYQQDVGSGLYYKEMRMIAPDGQPVRHIYWFNPNTGEYAQKNYPLLQAAGAPSKKVKKQKRQGKKRRGLIVLVSLLCIVLMFLGAGFVVRKINAPETIILTPEQIEEAIGIGEPDPATHPTFVPYTYIGDSSSGEEGTP